MVELKTEVKEKQIHNYKWVGKHPSFSNGLEQQDRKISKDIEDRNKNINTPGFN